MTGNCAASDSGPFLLVALVALGASTALGAQRVDRGIPYRPAPAAEQYLDLYAPPGATHAPVALFIHGGSLEAAGERRTAPMYAPVCPGLAARGVVCATMDYRLSPSFQWPAMPEDVAAALRWLRDSVATRGGDPGRILLVGHSSGCLLAALVALETIYLAHSGLRTTFGSFPAAATSPRRRNFSTPQTPSPTSWRSSSGTPKP